jgi:hypothetical protein
LTNWQKIVVSCVNCREINLMDFSDMYNPRIPPTGTPRRMDNKRQESQVFDNNCQRSRLRRRPKTDGGTMYEQMLINA